MRIARKNSVREKLTLVFGTILILSLQLVFTATTVARCWELLADPRVTPQQIVSCGMPSSTGGGTYPPNHKGLGLHILAVSPTESHKPQYFRALEFVPLVAFSDTRSRP